MKSREVLFANWLNLIQTFGVDILAAQKTFSLIAIAYSSSHRHYHTLNHIYHILSVIETLQTYTQNLANVQLAAWFHDIVYNTHANNNEEKSAEYAGILLSNLDLPIRVITNIQSLIMNTKYHQIAEDDFDSKVLIDADLAILAAKPVEYRQYANAIRQEYAWVPEAGYITGRTQILQKFLQRERIYSTPLMFEFGEESARSNIKAEIQFLLS
ncbi:MAG: hypothetical protein QNJ47_16235 [Nostocaceae cyanobacterium]|nr:hypothetical protein [Nostocaceae cyanobacterium]